MMMIVKVIYSLILSICIIPGIIMSMIGKWLIGVIMLIWAMSFRDDFSNDEIKIYKYIVRHPIRPLLNYFSIKKEIEI